MFLTDLFYPQKNDLFMWASLSFYAMFPFFNQAYMPISFMQCLSIPDFYGSYFLQLDMQVDFCFHDNSDMGFYYRRA